MTDNKKEVFTIGAKELTDNFTVSGDTLDGLKEVIEKMNENTTFKQMKSGDLNLLSFIGEDEREVENPDGTKSKVPITKNLQLMPGNLPTLTLSEPFDKVIKAYKKPAEAESLLNEWTGKTKLALVHIEKTGQQVFYFTSKSTLQTMDRFGMSGTFLSTPCLERDLMIAKRFEKDLGITAIIRTSDSKQYKKMFAILSDKYVPIDQMILFDIIKEIETVSDLGKCVCHKWEVNNFFTRLYVEFPEKATELATLYGIPKMIPGILITTSDTGDASFAVRGTWRANGSSAVALTHAEVKHKHSGKLNVAKIVDEVSSTIFADYAKLPDALCKLMSQDITDSAWDLKTSAGVMANQAAMEEVIKTAFKRLGITKAVGKKIEKLLCQGMLDEVNPSIRYTAYDVCMAFMSLPERLIFSGKDVPDTTLLQKACGQAPFIDYEVDTTVVLA